MSKFIAFRFTDNDFHSPLRETVDFLLERFTVDQLGEMSIEDFTSLSLRGLYAFDLLRDVACNREESPHDLKDYFAKTLKVSMPKKLDDLDSGFEGYIIDLYAMATYYYGY